MKCGPRVPHGRVKIGAEDGHVLDSRISVTEKGKKAGEEGMGRIKGQWSGGDSGTY